MGQRDGLQKGEQFSSTFHHHFQVANASLYLQELKINKLLCMKTQIKAIKKLYDIAYKQQILYLTI